MKLHRSVFISYAFEEREMAARLGEEIFKSMKVLSNLGENKPGQLSRYHTKLAKYWRELEQVEEQRLAISSRPAPRGNFWDKFYYRSDLDLLERLGRRQKKLEQLVNLGIKLVATGADELLELQFDMLESSVDAVFVCVDGVDFTCSSGGTNLYVEAKKFLRKKLREKVKDLRQRVRILIKKIRSGFIPDLRERFRTMMRFLFKNLDDCSDHQEVLFRCQPFLIFRINCRNEQKQ